MPDEKAAGERTGAWPATWPEWANWPPRFPWTTQTIDDGLPPDRALHLAGQIARGLAAAHEKDVVHGDLKPANVMVSQQGGAKILDLGLAKSRSSEASSDDRMNAGPLDVAEPPTWEAGSEDETIVVDGTDVLPDDGMAGSEQPAADETFVRGTGLYVPRAGQRSAHRAGQLYFSAIMNDA